MAIPFSLLPPPGVRFTKKERELFEALASHANCVLSRRYLLRNVWGYRDGTRTRTVDVHIRRLRKKLENAPGMRICTVFRQGYVMETADGLRGFAGAEAGRPGGAEGGLRTVSAGS